MIGVLVLLSRQLLLKYYPSNYVKVCFVPVIMKDNYYQLPILLVVQVGVACIYCVLLVYPITVIICYF